MGMMQYTHRASTINTRESDIERSKLNKEAGNADE